MVCTILQANLSFKRYITTKNCSTAREIPTRVTTQRVTSQLSWLLSAERRSIPRSKAQRRETRRRREIAGEGIKISFTRASFGHRCIRGKYNSRRRRASLRPLSLPCRRSRPLFRRRKPRQKPAWIQRSHQKSININIDGRATDWFLSTVTDTNSRERRSSPLLSTKNHQSLNIANERSEDDVAGFPRDSAAEAIDRRVSGRVNRFRRVSSASGMHLRGDKAQSRGIDERCERKWRKSAISFAFFLRLSFFKVACRLWNFLLSRTPLACTCVSRRYFKERYRVVPIRYW